MKMFWNKVCFACTVIGNWCGYFPVECDRLILALLSFMVVDYITGVMCAISDKKVSSKIGVKEICRKVLIFMLVGIANILDTQIIGMGSFLKTVVIWFYLGVEGISILENAECLGVPIPERLKEVLEQLHDKSKETPDKEKSK